LLLLIGRKGKTELSLIKFLYKKDAIFISEWHNKEQIIDICENNLNIKPTEGQLKNIHYKDSCSIEELSSLVNKEENKVLVIDGNLLMRYTLNQVTSFERENNIELIITFESQMHDSVEEISI